MFPRWRSIPAQVQTHISGHGGRGGSGTEMCYLYFHTSWHGRRRGGGVGGRKVLLVFHKHYQQQNSLRASLVLQWSPFSATLSVKQIKWKWYPSRNGTQPAEPAHCISDCASHHPQRWEAEHTTQPQSQHTNSSKNTKDALKCCHTLHSYVADYPQPQ